MAKKKANEPRVFTGPAEMLALTRRWRAAGESIGLVPTMGALHAGHMSLVERSVADCDRTVVSIYVNPTQFGEGEDLDDYPRTLEDDLEKCVSAGADAVFAPDNEAMYLPDHTTYVEVGWLTQTLCGLSRPGHFRGVTTVVAKLFNIVGPDAAYFGQKDAQQLAVVRRMVRDLDFPVKIVGMPIVREADGLAMSSRNRYLSASERKDALCLERALDAGADSVAGGETSGQEVAARMAEAVLATPSGELDYAMVVDPVSMEDVEEIEGEVLLALAVWIGSTRLIDNALVGPGGREDESRA